jgi:hypothetical protein
MYKDYVGVSMYNSSFYLGGQHVVFMLLDGGITLGTHVEYDNEMEIIPPLTAGIIFNHLYYSRLPLTRSSIIDGPVTGNICFNIVTAAGGGVHVNHVWVELFFEDYNNVRYPISGGEVKINFTTISQSTGPAEKMVGLYFEFPVHEKKTIPGALLALRVKAFGNRVGDGRIQQLVSHTDKDILLSIPLIGA